ncbi:MAG: type II toxin-antitoxin system Phd/YefM family antitoxin [Vicinamibacterales bacterium]
MWPHGATFEPTKTVGVRELKNRLSEYLRQARSGEGVRVTDRGQVVAELAPPGQGATDAAVPPGLLALARRNLLVIGAPADKDLYPPLPRRRRRRRTAAELLRDERGDR